MQGDERERAQQEDWKSPEEEAMQITLEDSCARARRQGKQNLAAHGVILSLLALVLGAGGYNLLRTHEALIFFAVAWSMAIACYLLWRALTKPLQMCPDEACLLFLQRERDAKIQTMRKLGRAGSLATPAVVAAWLGGGPVLWAKELGISSPGLPRFLAGPSRWL